METPGVKSYSNNFFLEGGDISRLAYQPKKDSDTSTVVLPQSLDGANSYKRESFTDNNKRINAGGSKCLVVHEYKIELSGMIPILVLIIGKK